MYLQMFISKFYYLLTTNEPSIQVLLLKKMHVRLPQMYLFFT